MDGTDNRDQGPVECSPALIAHMRGNLVPRLPEPYERWAAQLIAEANGQGHPDSIDWDRMVAVPGDVRASGVCPLMAKQVDGVWLVRFVDIWNGLRLDGFLDYADDSDDSDDSDDA